MTGAAWQVRTKSFVLAGAVATFLAFSSCSSGPTVVSGPQTPEFYEDNTLVFKPGRAWRLHMRWEPDPEADSRAYVIKTFRFDARSQNEQVKLTQLMSKFPSREEFFNWIEAHLMPLDASDRRESAMVETIEGYQSVLLRFRSTKPVERRDKENQMFRVDRFYVPDPLVLAATRGCTPTEQSIYEPGEDLGLEIVLETRDQSAQAKRWAYREVKPTSARVRRWSVGEPGQVSYRMIISTVKPMSFCPLPPDLIEEVRASLAAFRRETGIQW